jgi:hypothetical protein
MKVTVCYLGAGALAQNDAFTRSLWSNADFGSLKPRFFFSYFPQP